MSLKRFIPQFCDLRSLGTAYKSTSKVAKIRLGRKDKVSTIKIGVYEAKVEAFINS